MKPIRAVIFDIDDTIFDMATKQFIPSSMDAIRNLEKKGIVVILATGRPPKTALEIKKTGVNPSYIICTNGALVLDKESNVILERFFSEELCEEIFQYCLKKDIGLIFKFSDRTYEYIHKEIFEMFYDKTPVSRQNVIFGITNRHHLERPNGGVLGTTREMVKDFNEIFRGKCRAVIINDESSDLILEGVSKKSGLEHLLKQVDITPEECMSFGDNDNDLEINDYVGIGVAVGNCSKELRKRADYTTDTIRNDGVLKALKHFNLI